MAKMHCHSERSEESRSAPRVVTMLNSMACWLAQSKALRLQGLELRQNAELRSAPAADLCGGGSNARPYRDPFLGPDTVSLPTHEA